MLNVLARRQLLFSNAGGRRSFRQLERLVMPNNLQGAQMGLVIHKTTKTNQLGDWCGSGLPYPSISITDIRAHYSLTDSTWNIKGILRDPDSTSFLLMGAILRIHGIDRSTSNYKGEFELSSISQQDTVSFLYIGYETTNVPVAELIRSSEIKGRSMYRK